VKRLALWAVTVFVILIAAPVAHASAAELPGHWQVASAAAVTSVAVAPLAEAAAPRGWTDDDSVAAAGIGALLALGGTALGARTASARKSEEREAARAAALESQQREELALDTIDEIVVAVEAYLLLRKPGQTADKPEVSRVLSGLTRLHRLADGFSIADQEPTFRRIVTAALTTDLEDPREDGSIMFQTGDPSKEILSAASLSNLIRALADKMQKTIVAQNRAPATTAA
jgi:hypothetical protein